MCPISLNSQNVWSDNSNMWAHINPSSWGLRKMDMRDTKHSGVSGHRIKEKRKNSLLLLLKLQ